ncbi:MAG: DUF922 domain-containing protein [Pseudomonadota bacterium]
MGLQNWSVRVFSAAVAVTALSSAAPSAHAETVYKERVSTFELGSGIRTQGDLWRAIRARGATKHGQKSTTVGWASWQLRYRIEYRRRGNRCHAAKVDVGVDVTLNLPFWSHVGAATPDVRDAYACIKETVTTHEQHHGDIARSTGERLERRFWNELDNIECSQREYHATSIFNAVFNEGRRRQAAFDREDYARQRYQICARPDQMVSTRQGGWMVRDRNPPARFIRRGRRTSGSRQARSSSAMPRPQPTRVAARNVATRDAELQARFEADGSEGDTPNGSGGDGQQNTATVDWSASGVMRSAIGLFAILGVVICFVVWRVGRKSRQVATQASSGFDEPEWMSQAIEATAHVQQEDKTPGAGRGGPPKKTSGRYQPSGRTRPAAAPTGFGRRMPGRA